MSLALARQLFLCLIFKKKKEILQYEDKVYITFEDNVTELELRYKRKRKRY